MKRQILKSLSALCVSAMALFAASSLVVSCYDDSKLWDEMEKLDNRVKDLETLKANLEALTARVDALYTLKFQVTTDNELQYSFDNGATWVNTDVVIPAECDCPEVPAGCDCLEVSLVDNGDSVTITVGDQSFTIEKPEEIAFEIRSGKVYFASEATQTVTIKTSGIEDLSVLSAPKGWWAEISADGSLVVTAPDYETTQSTMDYETWEEIPAVNAASGYVKIHACGAEGKCMVGKLPVEVSGQPLVVNAYGGKAYFTLAGEGSYWNPTFFYGISTKESLEADTAPLLKALREYDWDIYENEAYNNNNREAEVVVSIAELLGAEPEAGVEYVVWALLDDNSGVVSMESLVLSYYSLVDVKAVEDESKKTAYNIDVTIDVTGADSYIAVAFPASEWSSAEEYASQMADGYAYGEIFGKLYKDSYSGSLLDVAEGTTYSQSGLYQPDWTFTLLVMPIDGRPADLYTSEDVVVFEFETAQLTAGGSVDAVAKQVTSYVGEVFDYDNYEYVQKEIVLDPYTQLGVEVNPSAEGWVAFYTEWLTEEDWATYGSDDELLVAYLLEGYGMTAQDVEFPAYLVNDVLPGETTHFAAFFVDKDGKYGKLAKLDLTSDVLEYSDIALTDVETNVADGLLTNITTLEVKPAVDGEVASYKYVWTTVSSWSDPFKGMDEAQAADAVHFSDDAVEVKVSDLVDGKIVIEGHEYDTDYVFAILPYDAEGKPAKAAYVEYYNCTFVIENVISDSTAFVGEPSISTNFDYYSEDYYSSWEDKTYVTYNYDLTYTVTPKAGYPATVVVVDAESYPGVKNATPAERASGVMLGSWGSYYTQTFTEEGSANRSFNGDVEDPAKNVIIMAVWSDEEGNYYYKEVDLSSEFAKMKTKLDNAAISPEGKQLEFVWEDMGAAPAVMDFGVTTPGKLAIAYDMFAVYGEDAGIPEEMRWFQYMSWDYELTPTDETSGVITISSQDHFGDVQTTEGTYSKWDGESCLVNFPMLMLEDVQMTVAENEYSIYIETGIMM